MSGGGGGGGGGFAPADSGVKCEALTFTAPLQSVQADAIATISVGDVLDVALRTDDPPVVEVRKDDGTMVGALIDRITELLRCMQQGHEYVADVLNIDGGHVRVQVRTQ